MSAKMWPFDGHVLFHVIDPTELAGLVTLLLAGLTGLRRFRVSGSGPQAPWTGNRVGNQHGPDRKAEQGLARPLGAAACTAGLLMLAGSHPTGKAVPFPHGLVLFLCACLGAWLLRISALLRVNNVHVPALGQAQVLHRLVLLARSGQAQAAGAPEDGDRVVYQLALLAGLGPVEAAELQQAASFRHLGRLAVPDSLLNKAAPLDEAERRLLRQAPVIGARLLGGGQSALFERAAEMALGHQECWDGTGYPHGLSGTQIPLAARIAALADQAVVLLPRGRTVEPRLLDAAVARLEAEAGRRLDPVLTTLFLDTLRPRPLSPVAKRLDNGQDGGGGAAAHQARPHDPAALVPAASCGSGLP